MLGLRRLKSPPELLLIRPSGPRSLHCRLALGWQCEPDAIWALRRQAEHPESGFFYMPWRVRKMQWKVGQELREAAELSRQQPPSLTRATRNAGRSSRRDQAPLMQSGTHQI